MNKRPRRLLGHPPLLTGESLASFLVRLDKENCYPNRDILNDLVLADEGESLEDILHSPRHPSTFDRLTTLTGIQPYDLYSATPHVFAEILTPPDHLIPILRLHDSIQSLPLLSRNIAQKSLRPEHASQFCPRCIGQSPHHLLIWTPLATSVCLQHTCLLVDQCPNCTQSISIREIVETRCRRCGTALKHAQEVHADEFGLLSQQVIQSWLLGEYSSPPMDKDIPDQSPRVLYRIIDGLRFTAQRLATLEWPHLHELSLPPNNMELAYKGNSSRLTSYQSYCVYTTAFKSITDWPKEFYKFLDALYPEHDNSIRTSTIPSDLGSLYTRWLEVHWKGTSFDFLQNRFDDYVAERYGLGKSVLRLDRLYRRPELVNKFGFVSINQAAEMIGVSPLTVHKMVRLENLTVLNYEASKNRGFVKKEELLDLQSRWSFLLNLEEVVQILGVSEDVALEMTKIGLFSAEHGPLQGFSQWRFSEKILQSFIGCIKDHTKTFVADQSTQGRSLLTLVGASQTLAVVGLNAASILGLVSEGKLPAYHRPYQVFRCGNILFDPDDLRICSDHIKRRNNWVGRADVARRLQVKDRTLAKWVKARLLSPVAIHAHTQYFDRDQVENFATEYVTSLEAASSLNVGELCIQNWVRQGRLQAVSGPGIDDCHAYRFNKEYLLRWYNERTSFGEAVRILGISRSTFHRWIEEGKIKPLEDMGGKQRWFSREAVLKLRQEIEGTLSIPK